MKIKTSIIEFKSKAHAVRYIQNILSRGFFQGNEENVIKSLIELHPHKKSLIGPGIDRILIDTSPARSSANSFQIRTINGKIKQFYYKECGLGKKSSYRRYTDDRYVYFITDSDEKYVKIGKSNDTPSRLSMLQTGHYNKLHIITEFKEDCVCNEKNLHTIFINHRHRGEWFILSEEIKRFMSFSQKQRDVFIKHKMLQYTPGW